MNPLAAPTDYWVTGEKASYDEWFPSGELPATSERAVYEYLGLLWMRLAR